VIQIDLDPAQLGRNYPAKVALSGDAKVTLMRLVEALQPSEPNVEWGERFRHLAAQWRQEFKPLLNSDASPIRPERLCQELTKILPADTVLISDTGHAGCWTGTMIDLNDPRQSYYRCAGSLGWGFPAALGAKCAVPDRPVLCFTGDGGFWYHLGELETALRCGLNTVTVINNNHSLNQDRPGVDVAYKDHLTGNAEEIWVFREDVDFAQMARSVGCFGIRVDRPDKIQSALEQALASEKPAVVDVVSDIDAFPPWTRKPVVE
jgi:acetolactate synthase-1/2/3 large subunit